MPKSASPSEILESMYANVISKMFPKPVQDAFKSIITQANTMEGQILLERLGQTFPAQGQSQTQPATPPVMSDEERALEGASTIGASRKYMDKRKKKKEKAKELLGFFGEN